MNVLDVLLIGLLLMNNPAGAQTTSATLDGQNITVSGERGARISARDGSAEVWLGGHRFQIKDNVLLQDGREYTRLPKDVEVIRISERAGKLRVEGDGELVIEREL